MASKAAKKLKSSWQKMPAEYFEPLTFGELMIGEAFIALPTPGDNDGHGGFLGTHHIFGKMFVKDKTSKNAIRLDNMSASNMPDSMYVIRV